MLWQYVWPCLTSLIRRSCLFVPMFSGHKQPSSILWFLIGGRWSWGKQTRCLESRLSNKQQQLAVFCAPHPAAANHNPEGLMGKRQRSEGRPAKHDLSRDDLLFLLSILEGELQVCTHIQSVAKYPKLHCSDHKMLPLKLVFHCNVCHARPEMRSSLCWGQTRWIQPYWQPNMVSADQKRCSRPCREMPSGPSSSTRRMCTKTQLQRYQNLRVATR